MPTASLKVNDSEWQHVKEAEMMMISAIIKKPSCLPDNLPDEAISPEALLIFTPLKQFKKEDYQDEIPIPLIKSAISKINLKRAGKFLAEVEKHEGFPSFVKNYSKIIKDDYDNRQSVETLSRILAAARQGEDITDQVEIFHTKIQATRSSTAKTILDNDAKPILSKEALNGLSGEIVEAICRNSEADPAAVLGTILSRFAAECGPGAYVSVGHSKQPARLFVVVVGKSSKSRKGTSERPVSDIFSKLDGQCRVSPGPLSSGEGIIYAVRDALQEWVIDKKTGSGKWQIKDPGVEDKRLCIIEEEFASVLQVLRREGNTLNSIIRCSWDTGDAEPLTKNSQIKTTGAHIGIVAHITIAELRALLSKTDMMNGFGNRFLWIMSERSKIVPFPEAIPGHMLNIIRDHLQIALNNARRSGCYSFSDTARELWVAEYPALSMEQDGAAGCMVNRGEAYTLRLALIYSLIASHKQIELDDLQSALAFWRYCHASAMHIFGNSSTDVRKVRIVAEIKRKGVITRTDIQREVFGSHIKKEDLDKLLNDLQKEGVILIKEERLLGSIRPTSIITMRNSELCELR